MTLASNDNSLNKKNPSIVSKIIYFFLATLLIFAIWFIAKKMEGQAPNITIKTTPFISRSHTFPISIEDLDSGIRKVTVLFFKDGLEFKLAEKQIDSNRFWNYKKQKKIELQVPLSTTDLDLTDGMGILQVLAWDSSFRNFGKGNKGLIEMELEIDNCAPLIEVLKSTKKINQGGSGVVLYQLSEPCLKSGIMVGDNFFHGYSANFEDKLVYLAFFAIGYKQDINTKIFITATDLSGNTSRSGFKHQVYNKNFAQDNILLSDQFLAWRMPEFSCSFQKETYTSLIDLFLKVNGELRELNGQKIREVCSETENKILWKGPFVRLPRSATKAGFADSRSYLYKNEIIDRQVHLGIDLASNANSAIPAANSGKVVFWGNLGIYGNTVIIDHGFGLFSLYSHLSKIYVKINELIEKGSIIGLTGKTGLAGGDHLHFAMMINNTYVNPIEWWDGAWIENNITSILHK